MAIYKYSETIHKDELMIKPHHIEKICAEISDKWNVVCNSGGYVSERIYRKATGDKSYRYWWDIFGYHTIKSPVKIFAKYYTHIGGPDGDPYTGTRYYVEENIPKNYVYYPNENVIQRAPYINIDSKAKIYCKDDSELTVTFKQIMQYYDEHGYIRLIKNTNGLTDIKL